MLNNQTRRHFLFAGTALAASACAAGQKAARQSEASELDHAAQRRVATIEERIGGRVGVFAFSPKENFRLAHRADELFAMCSTFKWTLAAAVLHRVDAGALSLSTPLPFGEADLEQWAPVTRERVSEGSLTIGQLCEAAVTMSDNTAANLLLDQIDGPAGLTRFFRSCGDEVTRLDREEPALNTNVEADQQDTTSPRAMASQLCTVLTTEILTLASRKQLVTWLIETKTGDSRLKAGFPGGTRLGHKTGSCSRGAVNDVAVFWNQSGDPYFIASYFTGSSSRMKELEEAQAEIGRIVAEAVL